MVSRTRIKICGLTRAQDMDAAVNAGADAVGLVFYPPSPRCVDLATAVALATRVPPFVTRVGLFVNEAPARVRKTLETVPLDLLQFHGDEDEAYCRQFGKPYIRAARVRPGVDLLEFARVFSSARALLLDTYAEGYGGSGKTFDWSLIPDKLPLPLVLSGGLHPGNVTEAVRALHPWAVDVSSGIEADPDRKGVKDTARIEAFVDAVRVADGIGEV